MTGADPRPDGAADAELLRPAYGTASLAEVMPAAAAALGVDGYADRLALLPGGGSVQRVCTVMVDGLGATMLAERGGHAPFLRRAGQAQGSDVARTVTVGMPSTTATSMATFGTALPPGAHGMIGYRVLDPDRDRLLNHLKWPADVDPMDWQPAGTVFEAVVAAGVLATMVGPAAFAGSGLTQAALRGAGYVAAGSLEERVRSALSLLRSPGRRLVHLYWGDLDSTAHAKGWRSEAWVAELERLDAALSTLARGLPAGTLLAVTADHGMVDCPLRRRLDIAADPGLRTRVRHVGGEPRLLQLYVEAGAGDEVLARWQEAAGERAWVRSRRQAEADGWFGPLGARAAARCGDVLVAARSDHTVVDTERDSASALKLVGQHGSLTPEEQVVPVLRVLR